MKPTTCRTLVFHKLREVAMAFGTRSHFFFFNDTATTEIYTLSLHDALPIYAQRLPQRDVRARDVQEVDAPGGEEHARDTERARPLADRRPRHPEQDQETHLPERGNERDVCELERLGERERRERLADAEREAPGEEPGLERGPAGEKRRGEGERQEEGEGPPDLDGLGEGMAQALPGGRRRHRGQRRPRRPAGPASRGF